MKGGAVDFLTKPVDEGTLLAAIKQAVARTLADRRELAHVTEVRSRIATLTPREAEVFALVVTGMLNKQIGDKLGIVEKTVKVHRARVMEKMRAASIAELVRLAGVGGVIAPQA
jgi:FixJ family two-component response regulator